MTANSQMICTFSGEAARVTGAASGIIRVTATAPVLAGLRVLAPEVSSRVVEIAEEDHCAGLSLIQRCADSSEITSSICFLLSGLASYITGTTLLVDGGYSAA